MGRLCRVCLEFEQWSLPYNERWGAAKFRHHPTASALGASARNQCHLCNLIEHALYRSRRPPGEKRLPDRQIWLQCHHADMVIEITCILATIEPLSLATAGSRDVDDPGGTLIRLSGSPATDERLRKSMQQTNSFWIVEDPIGTRFFYKTREIFSQDLFWALLNPYHQARLELTPLPGMYCS